MSSEFSNFFTAVRIHDPARYHASQVQSRCLPKTTGEMGGSDAA